MRGSRPSPSSSAALSTSGTSDADPGRHILHKVTPRMAVAKNNVHHWRIHSLPLNQYLPAAACHTRLRPWCRGLRHRRNGPGQQPYTTRNAQVCAVVAR